MANALLLSGSTPTHPPVLQLLQWLRNSCNNRPRTPPSPPPSTSLTFRRPRLLSTSYSLKYTAKTPLKPASDADIRPDNDPTPTNWAANVYAILNALRAFPLVCMALSLIPLVCTTNVYASFFAIIGLVLLKGLVLHVEVLDSNDSGRTSVVKLQIGLLVTAKSLQRDLNRITKTANTSTPKGMSYVLTETTIALLRYPSYCASTYSYECLDKGEMRFNQLLVDEQMKRNEETMINANNIQIQRPTIQSTYGDIMVTILVSIENVHKLPIINGSKDLKNALEKLGCLPCSRIKVVEVLWTPQDEYDTLSYLELVKEYPLLKPL